jgi:ketosteroid isomerase-like protein
MSATGISTEQARAFLEAYAAAFQRQDKDAVADRYAYPAHVVTHDGGIALVPAPSREAWLAVIERILQMYRAMGVRRAAMLDQAALPVRGDLYACAIQRRTQDRSGISENEQPKFMGVMRERG